LAGLDDFLPEILWSSKPGERREEESGNDHPEANTERSGDAVCEV